MGHKCSLVDGEIHGKHNNQVATLYIVPLASYNCLFKPLQIQTSNNNIIYWTINVVICF